MNLTPWKKIRVLIVDDSTLARRAIENALKLDSHLEVVGHAKDAYEARDKILLLDPDVLTLDLEMPRMDGLSFLKILMAHHPIPVVVVSALTPQGSPKAMEALSLGAVEVLGKPDVRLDFGEFAHQLAFSVKSVAQAGHKPHPAEISEAKSFQVPPPIPAGKYSSRRVILIGASTGGVEALRFLLPRLPDGLPPILVVQHIPKEFSRLMAERLDEVCAFQVREAKQGEELHPGLCLVAPGDFHLALAPFNSGYKVRITQSPPIHHCRPSVDVLFRSAAQHAGAHAVAALLTGMGTDGSLGLQALHSVRAKTLAEHEDSCVVYGMPRAAIELGAADRVVPLAKMPNAILQALAKAG